MAQPDRRRGHTRSTTRSISFPVNEPERNTALHGLAFDQDWRLLDHGGSSVTLDCEVGPVTGYPFSVRIEAEYRLDSEGLQTTVRATIDGESTAPYGVCPHPYLIAGAFPLNEWVLELPAATYLEVTADRLLPVQTEPVDGHVFDFREPRAIESVEIDHAFTDFDWDANGRGALELRDPAGTGVGMSWSKSCP